MVMDEKTKNFLTALKKLSREKWDRQNYLLAMEAGIKPGYLSEILRGKKTPSEKVQKNLAQACGFVDFKKFLQYGHNLRSIEEPVFKNEVNESCNEYNNKKQIIELNNCPHQAHHRLINKFKNKESAHEANKILLAIENIRPEEFERIIGYLEAKLEYLKKTVEEKQKKTNQQVNGEN